MMNEFTDKLRKTAWEQYNGALPPLGCLAGARSFSYLDCHIHGALFALQAVNKYCMRLFTGYFKNTTDRLDHWI